MDVGTTVSAVRKEYKDYLREKHPDWAENTVKTHVSDAFYIWNNTLLPSFWKTLIDDESMEIGRQAIYSYLKNDLLSDTAEVRAKAYFADLTMLKEFLDTVHGGVIKRVGYEIDCEETVYKYAKMVYDGQINSDQAVESMVNEVPCFNSTSHKMAVMLFQSGNKSKSICRGCKKIAMENDIDISFDNSIFEGIIPKKNTTDDILADTRGVRYWIYSPYNAWKQLCAEAIRLQWAEPEIKKLTLSAANALKSCMFRLPTC